MRNRKIYPILLALVVVLAASLACNALAPATPGVSNIYMAKDKDGKEKTNVFAPTDDFFVLFDVSGVDAGAKFQSRWYALDVEGQDPNTAFQTIDYDYQEGISNIYFQLTNSDGWPTGNFKVEIYMNDAKVGEQQFSVQ
jgi:hypothetical protein